MAFAGLLGAGEYLCITTEIEEFPIRDEAVWSLLLDQLCEKVDSSASVR